MPDTNTPLPSFRDLNLPAPLLTALDEVGYETPTPIQAQAIPHLLDGLDLLGRAPSGTGKTAAFALPLLARLSIEQQQLQVMVLAPTRELAIQVAEAFQRYAAHIRGFHVLPIYGGQDYTRQIQQLKRGMHVVVGTPGRVMDHMRKGTLQLGALQTLVLDEADEMLRRGFIDDIQWILDQTPPTRQMALFSATIPKEIQRIARRYLRDPKEIAIQSRTATAETIHQRYWLVSDFHKLDALTRILEVEPLDALIIFVRTKTATTELAERLETRGYRVAALNGDMVQKNREQMIERLKRGSLDVLVATDVAARGLDVDRVSHVINYDIPYDIEAYIHRIGRTGRAGRPGEAILFVSPRERRILNAIEKATRQKIDLLELPSTEMVNNKRIADFKQKITNTLAAGELDFMQSLLEQYQQEHDVPALEIAAALARMFIGNGQFLLKPAKERPAHAKTPPAQREHQRQRPDRPDRPRQQKHQQSPRQSSRDKPRAKPPKGMERFRIEVGHQHEVKPGNIVGAIANEAGLDAQDIGHIDIQTEFSLVDLPKGMPNDIFQDLRKTWVQGQRLNISRLEQPGKKKKGKRETREAKKKKPQREKLEV
uniref:ATP-dependent RNA helicase DeaD n=1 Tax=Candidatus Kentrum sp. LPFa TaxID=2126335 RepID=A0A450XEV3_9GAMM|nr:MAG: ATP-dependent RNA helicase DeaD [Candidatus Kentron sp. LPFa]